MPDPEFFLQCCDAGHYLYIGTHCGSQGICVKEALRPVGASLWFGWPYYFGLPPETLIYAHLGLLLLSVLLSVLAMISVLRVSSSIVRSWPVAVLAAPIATVSLTAHAIGFWPVLHVALADAPAGLFMLLAIWLLILSCHAWRWVCMLLAGLFLGLSLWVRAFYLYPVVLLLVCWALLWFWRRCRPWSHGLLFLALSTIAAQVYLVHEKWGEWSFLSVADTGEARSLHLSSSAQGYDTLYPWQAYYWSSPCQPALGVKDVLVQGDISGGICLLASRLYFYWGTYEEHTYILGAFKNMFTLGENFPTDVGHPHLWGLENLSRQQDVAMAPDGTQTADRFTIQEPADQGGGLVYFYSIQTHNSPHLLKIWLWADKPKTLDLAMYRYSDNAIVGSTQVFLGLEPKEYELLATPLDTSSHGIMIGKIPGSGITFGTEAGDSFYSWAVSLDELPEVVRFHQPMPPDDIRQWKPWLAVFNAVVALLAIAGLFLSRKQLGVVAGGIGILMVGMGGEALLIVPEQRFMIVVLVFSWCIAGAVLMGLFFHALARFLGVRFSK
ncbi:MAG: hypothetical protein EP312_10535 [Gammaproteobacteria bacterium]|nr:MAG: hypothetical protein EP312_10535 [Gammaproteobacteria bacterium]